MFLGVGLMALRGNRLAHSYSQRMLDLSQRYQATLREAGAEQIKYGVQLRQDLVAPFTRLIAAQVAYQRDLAAELRTLEQDLAAFAGEIGGFWEEAAR